MVQVGGRWRATGAAGGSPIAADSIKAHNILGAEFKDLKVTMTDPTHAVVAGIVSSTNYKN